MAIVDEPNGGVGTAPAVSTTFLATCRTAIALLSELAAFRTAYTAYDTAGRDDKGLYWNLAYSPTGPGQQSLAYKLRKAIRETVLGNADSTMTPATKEAAYQTLSAFYVPAEQRPQSAPDEEAALATLLLRSQL